MQQPKEKEKRKLGKKIIYTTRKSYQANQGRYLSSSARAGLIYRFCDYSHLVYMGSKLALFKP